MLPSALKLNEYQKETWSKFNDRPISLTFNKRHNFGLDQTESICRRQIRGSGNENFSL